VYWIGRVWTLNAVWGLEAIALLVFLIAGGPRVLLRLPRAAFWIVLIWSIVALLALADIAIGNRLYLSTAIYDHYLRVAITDAITRTGIPPLNPQYFLKGGAPLRYHYFWFALCSLVDRLGPGPRAALTASCVWAGLGLMSLVALFVHFRNPALARSRTPPAIALLAVTGLDILPVLLRLPRHIDPDMEWWNESVYSWIGAVTWAPHYIAALVAGFTGVLFLLQAAEGNRGARYGAWFTHATAAGFAFASCAGLNVYVALAFAASLAVWFVITLFRRWNLHSVVLLAAGVIALLLIGPYLVSLDSQTGSGSPLLSFAVRDFFPLHRLTGPNPPGILRLAFLPFNYLIELGFFALVLIWAARIGKPLSRSEVNPLDLALIIFIAVPLLLASFFRSGHSGNNDFGNTAPLLAQFVLVLWGSDFLCTRRTLPRAWRITAAALLVTGILSSLYELTIDRFYFPLADAGMVPPAISQDRHMAERAYAIRSLYLDLGRVTPRAAVFETNPDRAFDDVFYGLYARRQMAAGSMECGTAFGGDPRTCLASIGLITSVFHSAAPPIILNSLGIDLVIFTDSDPAFHEEFPGTRKLIAGQYSQFAQAVFTH
jgi:hypothetical protein